MRNASRKGLAEVDFPLTVLIIDQVFKYKVKFKYGSGKFIQAQQYARVLAKFTKPLWAVYFE